jgi:hypothetical protein
MRYVVLALASLVVACGPSSHGGGTTDGSGSGGGDGSGSDQTGCEGIPNCYSVYAHSDTTLYVVDLMGKTLKSVGPFHAPMNDPMTDLAVAPDNTIYTISETALYTANATDGHVTQIGSLSACGTKGVALTTLPNGQIWEGDFSGALCQIDTSTSPPTVKPPVHMGNNMALSGDLVAIGDGTVYGTAYNLSDGAGQGTQTSNVLVTIDMTTGAVTQLGATGYPKLFGVSIAESSVIGFTHDQTGRVVKIDPASGNATVFATFDDPTTQMPISFAGAGVSPQVTIIQ